MRSRMTRRRRLLRLRRLICRTRPWLPTEAQKSSHQFWELLPLT